MVIQKMRLFFPLVVFLIGCAPQLSTGSSPFTIEKNSKCISPSISMATNIDVSAIAITFNANTYSEIANLEHLVAIADADYACVNIFQKTSSAGIRSAKIYQVKSSPKMFKLREPQLRRVLANLCLQPESQVILYAKTKMSERTLRVLVRTGCGSSRITLLKPNADEQALYSRLATSNKSIFMLSKSATNTFPRDLYNCSDFGSQSIAQSFFNTTSEDLNRLDNDDDGIACEALDNISKRYTVDLASIPDAFPKVSSIGLSPSRCYVSGYSRRNGTYVRGYYRSC